MQRQYAFMQGPALPRPPPRMQDPRPFLQWAGAFLALAATPDALRRLRALPSPKMNRLSL